MESTLDIQEFRDLCVRLEQHDPEVTAIRILSTSVNDYFGDVEAKQLCEILKGNTTIQQIYMPINLLTVRGAACFMEFIINSPSLESVLLIGIPDTFEYPNQAIVVDVLIRAAIQNPKGISFALCGGPIARSSLMVALGRNDDASKNGSNNNHSFLSVLHILGASILVVDDDNEHYSSWNDNNSNNNNNLHQPSFSNMIKHFSFWKVIREDAEDEFEDDDESSRLMGGWFLRCASYLPHLEKLCIKHSNNQPPLPWNLLLSSKSNLLKDVTYKTAELMPFLGVTEQSEAFCIYLKVSKGIEKVTFDISEGNISADIVRSELQRLADAIKENRNITHASVTGRELLVTDFADDRLREIQRYCRRNKNFLDKWENGSIEIPPNLFPLTAAIAIKSQRGMTTLFQQRLPFLFSID